MKLARAIAFNDVPAIEQMVAERFGPLSVAVDFRSLADKLRIVRGKRWIGRSTDWSDGTWFMFVKNRLEEAGAFVVQRQPLTSFGQWNALHFFFLWIHESAEMQSRLFDADTDSQTKSLETARSKIAASARLIAPIDRTSARVTDWPKDTSP